MFQIHPDNPEIIALSPVNFRDKVIQRCVCRKTHLIYMQIDGCTVYTSTKENRRRKVNTERGHRRLGQSSRIFIGRTAIEAALVNEMCWEIALPMYKLKPP